MFEYIKTIEDIIKEGIEKGELIEGDPEIIASGIFGLTCSSLIYKLKTNREIEVQKLYHELEKSILQGLKKFS